MRICRQKLAAKSILFLTGMLLVLAWQPQQKSANPYGLEIVSELGEYNRLIARNSDNALVDLGKIPGIVLDIRYATSNNFTRQAIYPSAKAYLRKPVAEALLAIGKELKIKGMGLKIFDAYRPYAVTLKFYEVYPDTNFVASPRKGSRHNRGCAVDLTLIDLKTGLELPMPTPFDDFTEKSGHAFMDLPPETIRNRNILKEIMVRHGFDLYVSEWWHYDFKGWRNFALMDVPFDALSN